MINKQYIGHNMEHGSGLAADHVSSEDAATVSTEVCPGIGCQACAAQSLSAIWSMKSPQPCGGEGGELGAVDCPHVGLATGAGSRARAGG